MIFWGTIILIIVGLIVAYIGDDLIEDGILTAGIVITFFSGVAFIVEILLMINAYSGIETKLALMRDEYDALVFQIENMDIYDEDGNISEEVFNHIQEWNQNIIEKYQNQENFWIGIFIPNVYFEFDPIDYEELIPKPTTNTKTSG